MTEGDSPYAPPRADDETAPAQRFEPPRRAGQLARFLNCFVDTLAILVISHSATTFIGRLGFEVGYYWILEFMFGATLGKRLTGTRVVALDGGPATALQVLIRTLCRLVPLEFLSFMHSDPIGWHDRWSQTRVVARMR